MKGINPILGTDSYKINHFEQYPSDTEHVYSYLESRGGEFEETVFFGLQYYMMKYLQGVRVNQVDIEEALEFCDMHFGNTNHVNVEGWRRIMFKHNGKLPISIHALPEGTVSKVSTPLMTIENTDPELPWLTNYVETLLSMLWYPITVATQSRYMKSSVTDFLKLTGTPEDIGFKVHDFGYRGVSSKESASIGGAAHLTSFMGSDNIAGILMLRDYYDAPCAGKSIHATEHSTITSWGQANEVDAYRNVLRKYPSGPVACVSDSYDIYNACANIWGGVLKDEVMARDGVLIIRPDSGDPVTVVNQCLEILGSRFGYTTNTKGYKVLDPHVRLIQGDGIDKDSIVDILSSIGGNGWSADNIAFGSGGALLQKMNRDTNGFAIKCSDVVRSGKHQDVFKNPVGMTFKKSKAGRFDGLTEVFRDGEILVKHTHDEIRARIDMFK